MIAITGGGTGGHLMIAKAICEELNNRDIRPVYIGSTNGQDKAWFDGYPGFSKTYFLPTNSVVNKKGLAKLNSLKNILKQTSFCHEIFTKHEINTIFSVGGYSAAAASFAALRYKKKLFIHEQNAVLGRLNKLLKPFSNELFSSYNNGSFNAPYPISKRFFEKARIREKLNCVLFLGGSQGANFINNLALSLAKDLNQKHIKIIHQCGKNEFEKISSFYHENKIEADVFDFSDKLDEKMHLADFAISRAGASSVWELVASATPTLFIPFPYAANDHQYFNAKMFFDEDLAFLKRQNEIKKDEILDLFTQINLKNISTKLMQKAPQNGAKIIVDEILKNKG